MFTILFIPSIRSIMSALVSDREQGKLLLPVPSYIAFMTRV